MESVIPGNVKNMLVVLPSWVGDVVMATPVLRALRRARPQAHITGVLRPGLEDLLAGSPWLDALVTFRNTGLKGPWQLARLIRRTNPQAGLLLPNSFRSALTLRLSGCPLRIGYGRDGRSWLLTHYFTPPATTAPVPAIEYYAHLCCAALGVESIDTTVSLQCTPDEHEAANQLLQDVNGPFIILNPGASKPHKRWPAERFAAAADRLAAKHDLRVVVSGSPAEAEIVSSVVNASKANQPPIDLVQRGVRLSSLKAVIERASLLVTNDTGPRHIAAALGTPIVSLFGPTDHRWTILPGVREHRLLAEPFLPDELLADDHPEACAIDRIGVSDVVTACERLLS